MLCLVIMILIFVCDMVIVFLGVICGIIWLIVLLCVVVLSVMIGWLLLDVCVLCKKLIRLLVLLIWWFDVIFVFVWFVKFILRVEFMVIKLLICEVVVILCVWWILMNLKWELVLICLYKCVVFVVVFVWIVLGLFGMVLVLSKCKIGLVIIFEWMWIFCLLDSRLRIVVGSFLILNCKVLLFWIIFEMFLVIWIMLGVGLFEL